MTTTPKRRIRFNHWGIAEDPTGMQVVTNDGELYDVLGFYRREYPAAYLLRVRHFDGSDAPDIAASVVWVLNRDWTPERNEVMP